MEAIIMIVGVFCVVLLYKIYIEAKQQTYLINEIWKELDKDQHFGIKV